MSAAERGVVIEAPEVSEVSKLIDGLRNGQNTSENRRAALRLMKQGQLPIGTILELFDDVVKGWRMHGEVSDDQLDTLNFEGVSPVSR